MSAQNLYYRDTHSMEKKPLITMHGYIIKRDLKNMIIYMRSSGDIKEEKKEKEIESARNG